MHIIFRLIHELTVLITVLMLGGFGIKHLVLGGATLLNLGRITETRTLLRAIGQLLLAVACAWSCLFLMHRM